LMIVFIKKEEKKKQKRLKLGGGGFWEYRGGNPPKMHLKKCTFMVLYGLNWELICEQQLETHPMIFFAVEFSPFSKKLFW